MKKIIKIMRKLNHIKNLELEILIQELKLIT